MEKIITFSSHPKVLNILNRCQLYIHMILISDITSADGLHILPEVKYGTLFHRKSSLRGPTQGKPSKTDWQSWRSYLGLLEHENKLQAPLGEWISPSHQEWTIFYHPTHRHIYELNGGIWFKTPPNFHQVIWTPTYDASDNTETADTPTNLVPATISILKNHHQHYGYSMVHHLGIRSTPQLSLFSQLASCNIS